MDTENNHKNKPTDKPNIKDGQEEKVSPKKIKRQATQEQLDHPLHGVKLAGILESLVEHYGWKYLADEVNILCFKINPTMKVSLKFLRKFKWAREHVEDIYMDMLEDGVVPKRKD
ncbi:MAG TPA: DUF2132 domain-containing protein [Crocinitomicaceae bacterium]|nr:DUF2132 domain-containing protein [Crocinitomicaceae bacterium]